MTSPPVLIAQISDLHIKAEGALVCNRVDTTAALLRCVAELNALQPRPDLVVISGDLVDTPGSADYAHVASLLLALEIPFVAIPGNHDRRDLMREVFPHFGYAHETGALDQLCTVGDVDVILLDSHVAGQGHGKLEAGTLAWLDDVLAGSTDRPALIFLHHPPFITGIAGMDRDNLRNAAELAEIITKHERIQLVAAGHVHRATLSRFAGVPVTICPAPNHSVALDIAGLHPLSFRIEPPAFHLHAWFPAGRGGHLVTHQVPIGQFDGPWPFRAGAARVGSP